MNRVQRILHEAELEALVADASTLERNIETLADKQITEDQTELVLARAALAGVRNQLQELRDRIKG